MKKLFSAILLCSLSVSAFADWRMDRFDVDQDGFVTKAELELQGCKVNGLFLVCLTKTRTRDYLRKNLKTSEYIIRRHC